MVYNDLIYAIVGDVSFDGENAADGPPAGALQHLIKGKDENEGKQKG